MSFLIDILSSPQITDAGVVLTNGLVDFYLHDTTTRATVYQDDELINPHKNPSRLDASGKLIAYSRESIDIVLKDEDGQPVRSIGKVSTDRRFIISADISDDAITQNHITQSVAGDGLIVGSDGTFSLSTDRLTCTTQNDQFVVGARGQLVESSGEGNNSTGAIDGSEVALVGLGLTITTAGFHVLLCLASVPDVTLDSPLFLSSSGASHSGTVRIKRTREDGSGLSVIYETPVSFNESATSGGLTHYLGIGSIMTTDNPIAGTYKYFVTLQAISAVKFLTNYTKLQAMEI